MAFEPGQSGNPTGKLKGTKAKKTLEWEALGESITTKQAGNYNAFMDELWSGDFKSKLTAAELFLQSVEYFKPKLARQNIDVTTGGEPIKAPNIIIPGPEVKP